MSSIVKRGLGIVVALFFLSGCLGEQSPTDPTSTSYIIKSPSEFGQMENAVVYREQAADSHSFHLPNDQHLGRVDYNSRVEVDPSEDDLKALVRKKAAEKIVFTDNDKKRLAAYGKLGKEYSALMNAHPGTDTVTSHGDATTLKGLISDLNNVQANDSTETIKPMVDTDIINGDAINLKTLRAKFQAERGSLKSLVKQRAAGVSGKYGVSVQAFALGTKGPTPIHVQNYDDITDVGLPKQNILNSAGGTPVPLPDLPVSGDSGSTTSSADESLDFNTPLITLDEVKPGFIDLSATTVDRGSVVRVYTTLYKIPDTTQNLPQPDGNGGNATPAPNPASDKNISAVAVDQTSRDFAIDRLGLSYTVSANVVLVNQLGRGPDVIGLVPNYKRPGYHKGYVQGPANHNFLPAAGATLTLHFRPRWADDTNLWASTYDAVDPGIGMNIAALNATDQNSSTHLGLGLGVQASFFHDILQIGYGYDLTEGNRPQYWYVGIGIIDTLNQLGKLGLALPGSK